MMEKNCGERHGYDEDNGMKIVAEMQKYDNGSWQRYRIIEI